MKLWKVHITEFQSIRDSDEFEVGDINCLVGKNEAGKTALLQTLYRIHPIIDEHGSYSITDDYPRWDVEDYRLDVEQGKREPATVAKVEYELEDDDVAALRQIIGVAADGCRTLTLSKGYKNQLISGFKLNESNERTALEYILAQAQTSPDIAAQLTTCTDISGALEVLEKAETNEGVNRLIALLKAIEKCGDIETYLFNTVLFARVPKFLYFDEYYQMRGRANIESLQQRIQNKKLQRSDYPFLGLINRARLNLNELLNPSRTRELKNRLEGASNHLTKQIIEYWSQNRYLQLRFDVRPGRSEDPEGMQEGTNIWGEVYDSKHMVTTELGTRSRGFVWFFSFLAWYGDIQRKNQRVILLLDEPGLYLHAKAQEDLLRYFEAEIKGNHQLLYTTHSPFMVDSSRFDRVRIIQDLTLDTDKPLPSDKQGTKVLTEVLEASEDTLFPLQGALGYEIYQTLFIGPNNLVVEGTSDLLYLQAMSAVLEAQGRTGLHKDWTITPVGGSDKVPTFVALIGAQSKLNIAVLVDYQKADQQMIENLYKRKLLQRKKVLTYADFTGTQEADIEDMFDVEFYLRLVNEEYGIAPDEAIRIADLGLGNRILPRLESYLASKPLPKNQSFNHYRPARYLAENTESLKGAISKETLERFERVFTDLNALI